MYKRSTCAASWRPFPFKLSIRYLTYDQIDKKQWDQCISEATNGLIYGYSFYLDQMCPGWEALVWNDYEAVFPLTGNRKWKIHYLYQPAFTACLGLFAKAPTAALLQAFLEAIPEKFRYWDISLNPGNFFSLEKFNLHQRMNYVLPLSAPYSIIAAGYRENIRRNITKNEKAGNSCHRDVPLGAVLTLARGQVPQYGAVKEQDFIRFEQLCRQLLEKKMAKIYGIQSPAGELLSGCIFFFSHKRAFYILPANHPNGRTAGASHALIDAFIKDHATQDLLLDFEGSDISSLAFFYSSFGATEEKYSALRLNKLPRLVRWLKK